MCKARTNSRWVQPWLSLSSAPMSADKRPKHQTLIFDASLVGSALTCSQTSPTEPIRVAQPLVDRAKLKARLATLLYDSLSDDAKGIVNIAREKEIRKLANKLGREKESD
jgi:hypothetical protein